MRGLILQKPLPYGSVIDNTDGVHEEAILTRSGVDELVTNGVHICCESIYIQHAISCCSFSNSSPDTFRERPSLLKACYALSDFSSLKYSHIFQCPAKALTISQLLQACMPTRASATLHPSE